ncbi:MAG: hypothetical protein COU68_02065 [Candidatus Pacebacteria bacterium CG10_big_fil_rev_8_21_14_0_10_45_6]|nr:MAG: hypothetical protein COU68_02065 [Candidatus Pacebacteria bacterium CG10_big_fil_rev_8_21_14_0_10_45_6]
MEFEINLWAVAVAAIANMAIGFLWYHDMFFGKPWRKAAGFREEDSAQVQQKATMMRSMVIGLVSMGVMAYVLSHFATLWGAVGVTDALIFGFWIWLGFQATIQIGDVLWGMKPWKFFLINAGYQLVATEVVALILILWT